MPMRLTLEREELRYAVMRAIMCPHSGQVLDVRRAVLVEFEIGGAAIMAADVWDSCKEQILVDQPGSRVLDGRVLFK